MALLMVSPGEYKNPQAIANNIKYVTRTRVNERRREELLSYGMLGTSYVPHEAIEEFKIVQRTFRNPKYIGKRIFHETLHLNEDDLMLLNYDRCHIHAYAYRCAYYYYCLGFQIVFAVHWDQEKKFHIHFVGNSVNYLNGLKWKDSYEYEKVREEYHKYCLQWYCRTYIEPQHQIVQPISFDYPLMHPNNITTRKEKKYYAVARGKKCGIYEDYYDCQLQIENYPNALYKKCSSLTDAYYYLKQELEWRDDYKICIQGLHKRFQEYHSFLEFLNILKDKYELIPFDD